MKQTDDTNTNCNKTSSIYQNFLEEKENFIPYSNVKNERTIPKKIKVNLVEQWSTGIYLYSLENKWQSHCFKKMSVQQ